MSKYYRHEDIVDMIEQGFSIDTDGDKAYVIYELLPDLPTIEADGDCISRDWVLNRLTKYQKDYTFNELDDWQNTVVEWITMDINDAPSVVPKEGIEE